jgi:DNA-binding response OmpR family regulator
MSDAVRHRRSLSRLTEALVLPNPAFALLEGGRIVVASEDSRLHERLGPILASDGHDVVVARTCLDLLHQAGVTGPSLRVVPRPDALILDLSGAVWCNPSLLELVCSSDWTLPVVALCAPGDTAARDEARRLGVRAVLDLPVDEAALRAELMSIVPPTTPLRGVA